jgi:malonate transporter
LPQIDLVLGVLARVLPFFLLVGAGVALVRLRLLDDGMARGLSAYVFWIGFPALLIHSLSAIGAPGRPWPGVCPPSPAPRWRSWSCC